MYLPLAKSKKSIANEIKIFTQPQSWVRTRGVDLLFCKQHTARNKFQLQLSVRSVILGAFVHGTSCGQHGECYAVLGQCAQWARLTQRGILRRPTEGKRQQMFGPRRDISISPLCGWSVLVALALLHAACEMDHSIGWTLFQRGVVVVEALCLVEAK